jgi:hypothetical protein
VVRALRAVGSVDGFDFDSGLGICLTCLTELRLPSNLPTAHCPLITGTACRARLGALSASSGLFGWGNGTAGLRTCIVVARKVGHISPQTAVADGQVRPVEQIQDFFIITSGLVTLTLI